MSLSKQPTTNECGAVASAMVEVATVVEAMVDPVVIVDMTWRIITLNRAYEELTGGA